MPESQHASQANIEARRRKYTCYSNIIALCLTAVAIFLIAVPVSPIARHPIAKLLTLITYLLSLPASAALFSFFRPLPPRRASRRVQNHHLDDLS